MITKDELRKRLNKAEADFKVFQFLFSQFTSADVVMDRDYVYFSLQHKSIADKMKANLEKLGYEVSMSERAGMRDEPDYILAIDKPRR